MKLNQLTLTNALAGLKAKKFSLKEIYADINQAIRAHKKLNIYLTLNDKVADEIKSASQKPLAGLPIAVKDNFLTLGL